MKKKNIGVLFASLFAIVLITALWIAFHPSKSNLKDDNKAPIANLKETTNRDIPEFAIAFAGKYKGTFSYDDIDYKKLTIYEFDGTINNGWKNKTNHYLGVKVREVFEALGIEDYETARFHANGGLSSVFEKREINDSAFFVFTRDGKRIDERMRNSISLLVFDQKYKYSIENVSFVAFNTEGVVSNEKEQN